jgi:hypothetical protein
VEIVDYVGRGWFLLREGEHHYLTAIVTWRAARGGAS